MIVATGISAAALACVSHLIVGRVSATSGEVAAMAGLFATAWLYMRLIKPEADVTHALAVGSTWLVVAVIAELVVTARLGRAWQGILGSPDHPLVRNLFLFLWIFAPALFVRSGSPQS
jgi:hypothetical protein